MTLDGLGVVTCYFNTGGSKQRLINYHEFANGGRPFLYRRFVVKQVLMAGDERSSQRAIGAIMDVSARSP